MSSINKVVLPHALFIPRTTANVSRLTAYEKPELFQQTNLDVSFDMSDKFELPVCIRVFHRGTNAEFLVSSNSKEFCGKYSRNKCRLFHTVKEANDYLDTILIPQHGSQWMFELTSFNGI